MILPKRFMLLVCAAAPAAASDVPFDQSLRFPMQGYAGQFREHCMELQNRQILRFAVQSPHPVQLNVHHHREGGTVFLLDEVIADTEPKAVHIPADGEYCLELKNTENRTSGFELRLDYRVSAN